VSRWGERSWLTKLDEILRAEDRILQLQVATSLGVNVPKWVIASDANCAIEQLGEVFIVKPISLGHYWTDDGPMAVYTSEVNSSMVHEFDFGGAPFVAQEKIDVDYHYRIVTVQDKAWVAILSAEGRPLDWQQQVEAHREWESHSDGECESEALLIAKTLGIGYSSQDWLVSGEKRIFIDLNPGGQWLFLPKEISDAVSYEIAHFLAEED
jgi:glutathione synthase/RimK-type ligase-like ATP-grasp enzyme